MAPLPYLGRGGSHSYDNVLPDPDAELTQLGVSMQNHSYGTGIENYYGFEARDYDHRAIYYQLCAEKPS